MHSVLRALLLVLAAAVVAAPSARADLTESEAAVVLDAPLVRTGVGAGQQTRGYTFDLDGPRTLTHLGMFLYNGSDGGDPARQIGLWDADGALVAEVTVAALGVGGEIEDLGSGSKFIYIELGSPVVLLPGVEYTVGVWYSENNSPGLAFNVGFTTIAGFNYLSTVETGQPGGAFVQPTIVRPDRLNSYIGPNLRFDFAIPSVSALALDVSYDAAGGMLSIAWESQAGMVYDLLSSTDLAVDPETWTVFGGFEELPGTPPENVLSFPLPADAERFFVIRERPAPPTIFFSDDFEAENQWTTGTEGAAGTAWERGAPSAGVGPGGAASGTNCFGSNLALDYAGLANIWLRSPAIDLTDPTLVSAELSFNQFKDIETTFDFGSIRVLDASTNLPLGSAVETAIDGTTAGWEAFSKALPPEALGQLIVIEFRFESDDFMAFAGWYIDDVLVTGR